METRWDKALIEGVAEYLVVIDTEWRALRRVHQTPIEDERWQTLMNDADDAVESGERQSNVVSLLSGERAHPVRVASRAMREVLREMQTAAHQGRVLNPDEIDDCRKRWIVAREELIRLVHGAYINRA